MLPYLEYIAKPENFFIRRRKTTW